MDTRLLVLERRLTQTEEALVAERRASRRTAEVDQQVVTACPAGVDVEEIGRLEVFSGDSDLNGRVSSMSWSQWSLTVRSYFGEFDQTATRLLQRVQTDVEDSIITDNTTTSGETTHNTAVLCACSDLQEESTASGSTSSQRLPVRDMETAVQKIWSATSGEIPWNAPSPLVVDEISRVEAVGPSAEKQRSGGTSCTSVACWSQPIGPLGFGQDFHALGISDEDSATFSLGVIPLCSERRFGGNCQWCRQEK